MAQELVRPRIGTSSFQSESDRVQTRLHSRFQRYKKARLQPRDIFDDSISSPKSVGFHPSNGKLYVNSLEGGTTSVYHWNELTDSIERIKVIEHRFDRSNQYLFQQQDSVFDYSYPKSLQRSAESRNYFVGKPVEMTFTHQGQFLWVSYYRRSFDRWSQAPSALAIIDTDTDEILRVMPTGPLPKMVRATRDNRFLAVTHWGDNTLGLIDISSGDPRRFSYVRHLMRNSPLKISSLRGQDRDRKCGKCLRGTLFIEEEKLLIVGEMAGGQLIAFNYETGVFLGALTGLARTVRHIERSHDGERIYFTSNRSGVVTMISTESLISQLHGLNGQTRKILFDRTQKIGAGARTLAISPSDLLVWVAVNNRSQVVALDALTLEVLSTIRVDSFPVGLAVSPSGRYVVSTSQGRMKVGGGNAVNILEVIKQPSAPEFTPSKN